MIFSPCKTTCILAIFVRKLAYVILRRQYLPSRLFALGLQTDTERDEIRSLRPRAFAIIGVSETIRATC